jgi:hypothetical protein
MNTEYTGYADLHMHTSASDGYAIVRELLDYVAEIAQLDVIAITDHDILDASIAAWEQQAHYPFDIVPGVEVSSRDGHVLGLWITQPIPAGLSLIETVAAIHEQNGLAVLAHPFEIFVHPGAFWRYLTRPRVLITNGAN